MTFLCFFSFLFLFFFGGGVQKNVVFISTIKVYPYVLSIYHIIIKRFKEPKVGHNPPSITYHQVKKRRLVWTPGILFISFLISFLFFNFYFYFPFFFFLFPTGQKKFLCEQTKYRDITLSHPPRNPIPCLS